MSWKELKSWLFLDYWPLRYLRQGSLLTPLAVLTWSGVSRKTVLLWWPFTNAENQILKFSKSWNHWKFHRISSIGQLNAIRNSGVLKRGFGQDTWKVWGLKSLSKQYGADSPKFNLETENHVPKAVHIDPIKSGLIREDLHMRAHHRSMGHLLTPALKEIRRTTAERLLQWHAENRHENILFTD